MLSASLHHKMATHKLETLANELLQLLNINECAAQGCMRLCGVKLHLSSRHWLQAAQMNNQLGYKLSKMLAGRGYECSSYSMQMISVMPDKKSLVVHISWENASQVQELKTNLKDWCPVCLETKDAVILVPCGHTICTTCAPDFLSKQCPKCKAPVASMNGVFLESVSQ